MIQTPQPIMSIEGAISGYRYLVQIKTQLFADKIVIERSDETLGFAGKAVPVEIPLSCLQSASYVHRGLIDLAYTTTEVSETVSVAGSFEELERFAAELRRLLTELNIDETEKNNTYGAYEKSYFKAIAMGALAMILVFLMLKILVYFFVKQ